MFRKSLMSPKRILINGAGMGGLLLAYEFQKLNFPYKIIENKGYLAKTGAGIALPANAVQLLRHIGLGNEINQHGHQVNKIIYANSNGELISEASLLQSTLNLDRFVALKRHQLHNILMEGIESKIHFGTTIEKLSVNGNGVLVKFNRSKEQEEFSAVIGADGINSQVRKLAFAAADKPLIDHGVTTWRWISSYPTKHLQPTYMFGKKDVFMAYPISDQEVYCYAHVFDPENLLTRSSDHKGVLINNFKTYNGIAKQLLNILPDNQLIISGRLRSSPQPLFRSGRVALVGEASHAFSPFAQQGFASAAEDVVALCKFLKLFPIEEAFYHYEEFRKEQVTWVTRISDEPLKMILNADENLLASIYQKMAENEPLNVQSWKLLFTKNYLQELENYIAIHTSKLNNNFSARM